MAQGTIAEHDNGRYTYFEGYADVEEVDRILKARSKSEGDYESKGVATVRRMRYIDIDDEVHKRINELLSNPLILTANLRAIFNKNC